MFGIPHLARLAGREVGPVGPVGAADRSCLTVLNNRSSPAASAASPTPAAASPASGRVGRRSEGEGDHEESARERRRKTALLVAIMSQSRAHCRGPFRSRRGTGKTRRLAIYSGPALRLTRNLAVKAAMSEASRREVRAELEPCLARLWRYALVLSRANDAAEDLVQATCLRAIERADQFAPGTRLDRWLFAILRSIWLNEIRARRIREGGGFVDAEDALSFDGARAVETNILAAQVLKAIRPIAGGAARNRLACLRRRLQLRRSGERAVHPDRHGHEPARRRAGGADEIEIVAY